MKAYYIHWNYNHLAEEYLYLNGKDDDTLFHHENNAKISAELKVKEINDFKEHANKLYLKVENENYEPTREEIDILEKYVFDTPESYEIRFKYIVFADEE